MPSHNVQLGVTAVVAGLIGACAVVGFQQARRQERIRRIRDEIPEVAEEHTVGETGVRVRSTLMEKQITEYGGASDIFAPSKEDERSTALALRARQGDYDDDLILEQLARNRVFLTDAGLANLREAFIIVVGCGGVGSHAVSALARSGVSKIRLIDFDQVTLSSLNRHAVATLADVGTPKVHTIRKRLEQIAPWIHFDCRNELFSASAAESQLSPLDGQAPDYVIDAIDNIDSKVELLQYCYEHKMKVISSMGAGCKSDPTRVSIGDISASTDDPLSRSTRRRLRLAGIKEGIPVVFSSEKPGPGKAELLPLSEEEFAKGNVGELSVLKDFRVRILPVLGTMPAVFGLVVANHIMLEIGGYPHDYLVIKSRDKMYDSILAKLQSQEEKLARAMGKDVLGLRLPLTTDDVAYLVEEIFRGKSVITGLPTRLVLTRWRQPYKSFIEEKYPGQKNSLMKMIDLVVMTKEEAAVHDKEILRGDKTPEDLYSPEILRSVEERLADLRAFEKYR